MLDNWFQKFLPVIVLASSGDFLLLNRIILSQVCTVHLWSCIVRIVYAYPWVLYWVLRGLIKFHLMRATCPQIAIRSKFYNNDIYIRSCFCVCVNIIRNVCELITFFTWSLPASAYPQHADFCLHIAYISMAYIIFVTCIANSSRSLLAVPLACIISAVLPE